MRKQRTTRRLLTGIESLETRRVLAFSAQLVADVDPRQVFVGSFPNEITKINDDVAIYQGHSGSKGTELWRTDGTPGGTFQLRDISFGSAGSFPFSLTNVNGTGFFSATRSHDGRELWRTDGTQAGTVLVEDIRSGLGDSNPQQLVNVNGTLYFTADDGIHGTELWKSNGTAGGTKLVRDISLGSASSNLLSLTASNGLVYFALEAAGDVRLWRSDGTEAGTIELTPTPGSYIAHLTDVNGTLLFVNENAATGRELWRSDGSVLGTQPVKDINLGPDDSNPRELVNVAGTLFFQADDGSHGVELWKSNGTDVGTVMVDDLNPGDADFGPVRLANIDGELFFTDQVSESLWKSNGEAAGTQRVIDTRAVGMPRVNAFTIFDGTFYFAGLGGHGLELWKSDGTQGGTVEVKDLFTGRYYFPNYPYGYVENSGQPNSFTNIGGKLVFRAVDAAGGHLWTTDGTDAGTVTIDDQLVGGVSADVGQLFNFNGKLLFGASDSVGLGTWVSDGTAAGTQRLADAAAPSEFATIGGLAYFAANGGVWKTNGTPGGTLFLSDVPGSPSDFVGLSGKVFFTTSGDGELWITNGTTTGTLQFKDIRPGPDSATVEQLMRLGNRVVFTANDGVHGNELWSTDGTAAGTQLLKDISPFQNALTGPQDLFVLGNTLYFTASDGVHGRELWKSDGTAAGTVMVKDIAAGDASPRVGNLTEVNGRLYFTTSPDGGDKLLWKTDGTAAGTVFIANIGTATELTNGNGTLYFSSDVGGTGAELWKSNGTAAGTMRVKDLIPGPGGSQPRELQGLNGVLFFEADLPGGGRGFWQSNGTAEGTVPVLQDPAPLTGMRFLTNVSGQLFFAGTDVEHGEELWKLTTGNPKVSFSGGIRYKENDPLLILAPFAGISDADNASFPGGRLSVTIVQNFSDGDRLEIRNQGNGPGQIGVSGRTIRYGGVVIGQYLNGQPGSRLIIDLNANASVAIAQTLLRNIGFRSDSEHSDARWITVQLTDGSGGIGFSNAKVVYYQPVNDAPRLVLGGQVSYKNNSAGVLLAPSAAVTDADSVDFAGALLTVEITSARGTSNRLQLGGGYSIDGDRLLRNGVEVGTVLENGFGWNDLRLRFNSQMNAARVQELIRSLRFRTVDNTNLDPRTIAFTLTDGDGGVSAVQTKTVNVTA